ncbi:ABC transporter permease subunit [Salipiger sp. P9]|uniref:ABC transporter permease n=1 Tax=Salipiger pentaromativorans TaxID=2943193 RepID=UPI002157EDFF|nr:ABC transporter permease subunit [Salipiger pentaromativorans]MCR8546745.1 ABC transporter permease subunit [Salipiger pentaromativorans]
MLGPVAAGLAGTLLPAFGVMPALGRVEPGFMPFHELVAWPGLPRAMALSLGTGFAATALALAIALLICAGWQGTRAFRWLERALSPLLSVPHAAAAFGFAFLIAPSGWIARALAPATGWERPPDLLILQDPLGLSLIAGLVIKEVPFLLLMTLAALPALRPAQSLATARSLGYGRSTGWLKTVFPRLYPQIRLPVYAVLAFSMSVVDVAMILGPSTPPTLSVQILRWMNDPDLALRLRAAAGAVLQLALTVAALGLWRLGEYAVARLGRRWIAAGGRGTRDGLLRGAALALGAVSAAAVFLGLAALAVWSVAGFWGFPALLPDTLTLKSWMRQGPMLLAPAADTALIALVAVGVALALVLACLEAEDRFGLRPTTRALWLLYLPLIVPQIAFLPGLQLLALVTGIDGSRGAVIAGHVIFVLPYVFLSLSDPYRGWDARHGAVARALGAGPARVFWQVRLPMLLRPVLTAAAVGAAVSVGQFLPTLLLGAGRVPTLTTEAVALASGGARRVIGVTALAQTAAAFVPFALALLIPALVWRNRRGLRHG